MCRGRNCLLLTGWYSLSDHQHYQSNCHFQSPGITPAPFGPTLVKIPSAKTDLSWAVMKAQQPQFKEEQFGHCYSWPDRSSSCRHSGRQSWPCTTPLVFPAGLLCPLLPSGVTLHIHLSFWCQLLQHLFLAMSASGGEGWAGAGGTCLFTFSHASHCI